MGKDIRKGRRRYGPKGKGRKGTRGGKVEGGGVDVAWSDL